MKRKALTFVAFLVLATVVFAAATEYDYTGVTTGCTNLDSIEASINNASFTPSLTGLVWNDKDDVLHVRFDDALSAGEKSTLDTIISTNTDWSE
jgi:hypothetical protein